MNARKASLSQIDGGFAKLDPASASKMKEGCETLDRSAPKIDPSVSLKPAVHKDAAAEAATVASVKTAKRASLGQIADGFAAMEPEAAQKLAASPSKAAPSNDRSAPAIEPGTAPKHEFAGARRKSLDQIKDGFANMDPASANNMKMGVETHDRSAPAIDPTVALKPAAHKDAAAHAAAHATVKTARKDSLAQIADGFSGMAAGDAAKFSGDASEQSNDRSAPAIEPGTAPKHEFATARKESMKAIDGFGGVGQLAETSTHDRSEPRIAPDVKLKPAMHKDAAAEAATVATVKTAKKETNAQIAGGFDGIEPTVARKLSEAAPVAAGGDRSAPSIDPQLAPKHELAKARGESLKSVEKGGISLKSTAGATADRSAPAIDGSVTLSTHDMGAAVKEAAATGKAKSGMRASMHQITDGFANLSAESATRLSEGAETNDRSAPAIEPGTAVKHEFATARGESLKAIQAVDKAAVLKDASAAAAQGDRSAPVCGTDGNVLGGHAAAHRASLQAIAQQS